MKRAIVVHGWGGHPSNGWFPWLKSELEAKGFQVDVPAMPDTDHPRIDAWVEHLARVAETPDEETFFVGHSIGCQTIMRYLQDLPASTRIGGVVFVGGWVNLKGLEDEDGPIAKPWLETPIKWDSLKQHKFVALFSTDDSVVPVEDAEVFKGKLNAKVIIQEEMGHFDTVSELPNYSTGVGTVSLMEILPVSFENIDEASKLANSVFPQEKYTAESAFRASLDPENNREFFEKFKLVTLKYWVAVDEGRIVGTTGRYTLEKDKEEANWLGWYCVAPEYRGRGFGKDLLQFIIDLTKKEGKKFLRLYTSNAPGEETAQVVYKKFGFVETGREPEEGTAHMLYFYGVASMS